MIASLDGDPHLQFSILLRCSSRCETSILHFVILRKFQCSLCCSSLLKADFCFALISVHLRHGITQYTSYASVLSEKGECTSIALIFLSVALIFFLYYSFDCASITR